ncbi:MAG: TadE/TadG family type IV pilus assembly protein [Holosporales bacterium]|jgi:Flp pilus assembly protein TadG
MMFCSLLQRFCRGRGGTTILEFALLAPLFFIVLFGVIEVSVIIFKSFAAEHAINEVGRKVALGQISNNDIRQTINNGSFGFITIDTVAESGCNTNCVCVVAFSNVENLANAQKASNGGCPASDGTTSSTPDALVLYQLRYRHQFFTPLGSLLSLLGSAGGGMTAGYLDMSTSTLGKNQPY